MDTSLAEDVQHTATTLHKDSFFFMSPYRSFTTSGCFARFSTPAVGGDDPASAFQQQLTQAFADAKAAGIANPVMVGAIPFDTRQPSSLFIPQAWQPFARPARQQSARYAARTAPLTVKSRPDRHPARQQGGAVAPDRYRNRREPRQRCAAGKTDCPEPGQL